MLGSEQQGLEILGSASSSLSSPETSVDTHTEPTASDGSMPHLTRQPKHMAEGCRRGARALDTNTKNGIIAVLATPFAGIAATWLAEHFGATYSRKWKLALGIVFTAASILAIVFSLLGFFILAITVLIIAALSPLTRLLFPTKEEAPAPVTPTNPVALDDIFIKAKIIHFKFRCDDYRCDQATLDLAYAIAGTPESVMVRQKILRFLFLGTPRQELLSVVIALYGEETPRDPSPTLRCTIRQVAEIVRVEYRPKPYNPATYPSFLLYLQGLLDLLALNLKSYAMITEKEAQECANLFADLDKWGFGSYATEAARRLSSLVRVDVPDQKAI